MVDVGVVCAVSVAWITQKICQGAHAPTQTAHEKFDLFISFGFA